MLNKRSSDKPLFICRRRFMRWSRTDNWKERPSYVLVRPRISYWVVLSSILSEKFFSKLFTIRFYCKKHDKFFLALDCWGGYYCWDLRKIKGETVIFVFRHRRFQHLWISFGSRWRTYVHFMEAVLTEHKITIPSNKPDPHSTPKTQRSIQVIMSHIVQRLIELRESGRMQEKDHIAIIRLVLLM